MLLEVSWLGVRCMLHDEGLAMGCVGGFWLYLRVRRGG